MPKTANVPAKAEMDKKERFIVIVEAAVIAGFILFLVGFIMKGETPISLTIIGLSLIIVGRTTRLVLRFVK